MLLIVLMCIALEEKVLRVNDSFDSYIIFVYVSYHVKKRIRKGKDLITLYYFLFEKKNY